MTRYGYQRPGATLRVTRKRPVRRKKPSFFFKFLAFLIAFSVVVGGLVIGGRYAYYALKNAQLTDWHVKTVEVTGLPGAYEKEVSTRVAALVGKPFSMEDASKLRAELAARYPTLTKVSVSRGMLSGRLKISARPRQPVARFVLPDHSYKYIDEESIIYANPQETRDVLPIKLVGQVPTQLDASFVDLVHNLLKFKKSLPFQSVQFNATERTITLTLPDQSIIHFGPAVQLTQKAQRAAQIMEIARAKYPQPVELDFTFFEKGKVLLTQIPH